MGLTTLQQRLMGLLVAFLAVLLLGGINSWYIGHTNRENDHRWCRLLATQSEIYRERPPQTDTGRAIAAEIDRLFREFDCVGQK